MTRIEQIKLIADFMDSDYEDIENLCRIDLYDRGFRTEEILGNPEKWVCYHNDFSCLMEVVEQIESLGYIFQIKLKWAKISDAKTKETIILRWEQDETKLDAVFYAVIEFILWYNENK